MAVKSGYKQTEVGIVPEEWEVKPLQEVGKFAKGKGLLKEDIKTSGRIPAIPYTALYTDFSELLNYDHIKWFVDEETQTYIANEPCVLIASSSNMAANTGKATALTRTTRVAIGREVIVFKTASDCSYISFLLSTSKYRQKTLSLARGTTIKHLYPATFHDYKIAHPSITEQRAIAKALSDVDALLGALERIIAKKRDLKQASMQQLLTGQTRLPGFSGEWEETTLGAIVECIIGLTYHPDNVVEHGLLVLRSSNVQGGRLAYENNVYVDIDVNERLITRLGDILICVRNGSRTLIGKSALIDECAAGTTFGAFMTVYRTAHWRFISHAFQSESIQRQIRDNIGATINQITNKDMKALRLKLPSSCEQTAIATVLSDMDAELTALEQRLTKTRTLKQGMMQELLTGRTRLL